MIKTKIKRTAKKIIIGLFLALCISTTASILIQNPTNVAYAVAPAACKDKETADTCTKAEAAKCPPKYTEATDKKLCKKEASTPTDTDDVKKTISFLIQIQGVLNTLIWPVLVMTGGLLDNSILFGNGMEERLREIWIPIRNIVNILFVIALVAIALYNVLGIGEEGSSYSIKAMLPKIIVGIIAVNFSFLGIKLFLDAINVLTVSIFALPNQVGQSEVLDPNNKSYQEVVDLFCRASNDKKLNEVIDVNQFEKTETDKIYQKVATDGHYGIEVEAEDTKELILAKFDTKQPPDPYQKKDFQNKVDENIKGSLCEASKDIPDGKGGKKDGFKLTSNGALFLKRWNSRNAALALALNLSNIVFYEKIDPSIATIEKLLVNAVLSLLLYLVFLASFIALFVVLLARLVVMWLAIALSPVLLLGLAVPELKEKMGFGELITQFVQNAIAPLTIALSLTIGWIMLNALQGVNGLYNGGEISFTAGKGLPVVGLTTMQDLLVGVGTIGVIWLGVFTAASKSIAAPVTDMLKGALKSAGTYIGTMPLRNAPLFHIDLPGVEGDENYTGTQVMEAFHGLTRPKEPTKLLDAIRGDKSVTPEVLHDPKKTPDKKAVYSWILNTDNKAKLLDPNSRPEIIQAIKDMESRNPKAFNALMLDSNFKKQWEIITGNGTEAEKKTAAEKIIKVAEKGGGKPLTGEKTATPKSSSKTDKPKEEKAPDQPPVEHGKTKVYGNETLDSEEKVLLYTTQRRLLSQQITEGVDKKALQTSLTSLNNAVSGTPNLTVANLKAVLSKADYEALVAKFDNEAGLTTFLAKELPAKATGGGATQTQAGSGGAGTGSSNP